MELNFISLFWVAAFLLGLCLGSFYNVCVHRYLTQQSVVFPGSHCPNCGHVLSWWENIPVLSYLLLRARCYSCKKVIHWRYPALELCSGFLALALALRFGPSPAWLLFMTITGLYLIASFIDFEARLLPDVFTFTAFFVALGIPLVTSASWVETLLGAFVGSVFFLLIQQFYLRVRHMHALGTGDVKLMLSLGALTGFSALPFLILISALLGLAVALPVMIQSKGGLKTSIPFGPFLCVGGLLTLFLKPELLALFYGL